MTEDIAEVDFAGVDIVHSFKELLQSPPCNFPRHCPLLHCQLLQLQLPHVHVLTTHDEYLVV